MSTAAELGREVAHPDHSDRVAVLLAEERHRALLLRLVDGGLGRDNRLAEQNVRVDEGLDGVELFRRQSRVVREVEAAAGFVDEGARLLDMIAENGSQSRLEQVSR